MSDLLERLRNRSNALMAVHEAADEIERLQQQVSMMQQEIEGYTPWRELQENNRRLSAELAEWKRAYEAKLNENGENIRKIMELDTQLTDWKEKFWREREALEALSNDEFARAERSEALVADFKRRAVDTCRYWGNGYAAECIESLPLIGEK